MEKRELLTIELTKKGAEIFRDLMLNPNKNNAVGWDNLFGEFGKRCDTEIRGVYFNNTNKELIREVLEELDVKPLAPYESQITGDDPEAIHYEVFYKGEKINIVSRLVIDGRYCGDFIPIGNK